MLSWQVGAMPSQERVSAYPLSDFLLPAQISYTRERHRCRNILVCISPFGVYFTEFVTFVFYDLQSPGRDSPSSAGSSTSSFGCRNSTSSLDSGRASSAYDSKTSHPASLNRCERRQRRHRPTAKLPCCCWGDWNIEGSIVHQGPCGLLVPVI